MFASKVTLVIKTAANIKANALFGKFIQRHDLVDVKFVKSQEELAEIYFSGTIFTILENMTPDWTFGVGKILSCHFVFGCVEDRLKLSPAQGLATYSGADKSS